jgi:hypothetical protein
MYEVILFWFEYNFLLAIMIRELLDVNIIAPSKYISVFSPAVLLCTVDTWHDILFYDLYGENRLTILMLA